MDSAASDLSFVFQCTLLGVGLFFYAHDSKRCA